MTFVFLHARFEAQRKQQLRILKLRRKNLRSKSSVLQLEDEEFIKLFCVDKETFKWILSKVKAQFKASDIPSELRLAVVLRFLTNGGYQLSLANEKHFNIARSTFSKILRHVLPVLQQELCHTAIQLAMSKEQLQQSHDHFQEHHQLPRIAACLDGMHIRMLRPQQNDYSFINKRCYHSINAMLICNYKMEILAVDATNPGGCSDAFVWDKSEAKEHLLRDFDGHYILADAAYALENIVLTPYRTPEKGSKEHRFNEKHAEAMAVMKNTISMLKRRFGCLRRTLNYEPLFVCTIFNVCCALHNICLRRNIPVDEGEKEKKMSYDYVVRDSEFEDDATAVLLRDQIAATIQ